MSSPPTEETEVSAPPSPPTLTALAPPTITTTPSLAPAPVSPSSTAPSALLAPPTASSSSSTLPTASSPLKRKVEYEEYEEYDDPFLDEESAAFKAAKSASEWNGQLKWGRQLRGPQWDWGTGMYHVPIGSAEYYAGVVRMAEGSAVPPHLRQDTTTSHTPAPGSPSTPGGSVVVSAGTYDSGRPRRTRAAMGR